MDNEKAVAFCAIQVKLGRIKLEDINSEELRKQVKEYMELQTK